MSLKIGTSSQKAKFCNLRSLKSSRICPQIPSFRRGPTNVVQMKWAFSLLVTNLPEDLFCCFLWRGLGGRSQAELTSFLLQANTGQFSHNLLIREYM
jgi:hypothetical protein